MGKGSTRRPSLKSIEEVDLRWQLARGEISRKEFDEKIAKLPKKEPGKVHWEIRRQ